MKALAAWCAGAAGWRRMAFAWALGGLATAVLPPVSATPALVLAFTGLVWLLDGAGSWRRAAWDGWWFGFGFLTTGLYWIANALLTDPAQFGWLLPFSLFGLPAVLAIFAAVAAMIARALWSAGPLKVLSLAAAWSAAEWLRGHLLTGFPWNLVGYTWTWSDQMLQANATLGIYGVSFVTVAAAASPSALVGAGSRIARWAPVVVAALALLLAWSGGAIRLDGAGEAAVPGVHLRVVQANIAEPDKWQPALQADSLQRHSLLTRAPGIDAATVVIWPETAVSYFLEYEPDLARELGALLPPRAVLITGAPRARLAANGDALAEIWNSVAVLDARGAILASYDKAHLVPFGEYVPLRGLLGTIGLKKIVPGALDYSAGRGPSTISIAGVPAFGALVCYEVIFPEQVVDPRQRPAWLVNVTNDAWYGNSAGPYQHFASARVRAVEQGLPLVRAANTGVSGVIDSYGRVRGRLALGTANVLDAALPVALPPTPYARFGDILFAALWGISAIVLVLALVRRGRSDELGT